MVGRDTQPCWVNPVTHLHKDHILTWRTHTFINLTRGRATEFRIYWRKKLQRSGKRHSSLNHISTIIQNGYRIPGNVLSELCTLSRNCLDINILQAPVLGFFFFFENELSLFRKASELETNINGDKVTKRTQWILITWLSSLRSGRSSCQTKTNKEVGGGGGGREQSCRPTARGKRKSEERGLIKNIKPSSWRAAGSIVCLLKGKLGS